MPIMMINPTKSKKASIIFLQKSILNKSKIKVKTQVTRKKKNVENAALIVRPMLGKVLLAT